MMGSSWRPIIRLARRDAARHWLRTMLAALLIALPVSLFSAYTSVTDPGPPTRDQALSTIPEGAQARITAAALPRDGEPFEQTPEGAPFLWFDDQEVIPASAEAVSSVLPDGTELAGYWSSPQLVVTTGLDLAPGEKHSGVATAEQLSVDDLDSLAMAELREADPGAFELMAAVPTRGELPLSSEEVMLSTALAERLGADLGDSVGFIAPPDSGLRSTDGNTAAAMQDSMSGYRVTGIAEGSEYAAWAPSGWLSTLVDENPEGIQAHWLVLGDEPVTWDQAKALNEMQAFAVSRHVLENYPSSDELYPVDTDPMVYVEALVGLVVAFVIGGMLVLFLVTPAIAISAEQARRMLGLASAVGATPRDLRRMILSQGLVIGLLGGLVGAVLGFAVSLGFNAWLAARDPDIGFQQENFGASAAVANYPWWTVAASIVIAVLLGLLASLGPARTASRYAPVDAIRDRRPRKNSAKSRTVVGIIGFTCVALSLIIGAASLMAPIPEYPADLEFNARFQPGTAPPGTEQLAASVAATVVLAVLGIVLVVYSFLPTIGSLGSGRRPIAKMALRDTADHPSRTVPAVLGVVFSLMAASYLAAYGASQIADSEVRYSSLNWDGTFMVSTSVPVNREFDRAAAGRILLEIQEDHPQIIGGIPLTGLSRDSSVGVEVLPPENKECPKGQFPHVSSSLDVGAEFRCVSQLSMASYNSSIRIGSIFNPWDPPLLMDGSDLEATRLNVPDKAVSILDNGGVLVDDAALIDDNGMVRLSAGPYTPNHQEHQVRPDLEVRLPAVHVHGAGAGLVMAPATAQDLGVDAFKYIGTLAVTSEPLDSSTMAMIRQRDTGGMVNIQISDADSQAATPLTHQAQFLRWPPFLLLAAIAVAAAAISVLLSATQGRRDAATAHAVGADWTALLRVNLGKAGIILGIGIPIGLASGIVLAAYQVAWNRRLEASGAWMDTVIAWETQLVLALVVAGAGMFAAFMFGRPPKVFLRRRLD